MFTDNLRRLRLVNGLSQCALARDLGVAQSTVGMWESGKRQPDLEMMKKIAEMFCVSLDFLMGRQVRIPVLGQVQAGQPSYAQSDVLGYEELSSEQAQSGEYFALKIRGDSMEPRMREGDTVIVHSQQDLESGEIGIVLVGEEEATVKKVIKHPAGITLMPLNSKYTPLFYTPQQVEQLPVRILGKVIELRAKF